MEISKSFDEKHPEETLQTGTMAFGSWERLLPQLNIFFAIKPNEKIVGITADKEGIKAKIETNGK